MLKIILEGHIVVSGSDLAAVMLDLLTHIQLTRQEEGCLCFDVTQSPDADNVYVYEKFIDWSDCEAHRPCVQSSDWGRVPENVKRHYLVSETD